MPGLARTFILLAAMTALFLFAGFLIGGQGGMLIALVIAMGMNVFAYWNSGEMVLRMHNARPADRRSAPEFYGIVEQLARRAQLPMPRVFVIDSDQPNAFATGRNPENAAVAATTGLLRRLSQEEVAGVMAHELAHVRNRDTLIMTVTATLAGALSMLANFAFFFGGSRDNNNPMGFVGVLLMAILAPMAAGLVQMAISRTREYSADRSHRRGNLRSSGVAGQSRLVQDRRRRRAPAHGQSARRTQNPATAHMFIINPLHAHKVDNLFSTHPSTANRVARLRQMAGAAGPSTGLSTGPWG